MALTLSLLTQSQSLQWVRRESVSALAYALLAGGGDGAPARGTARFAREHARGAIADRTRVRARAGCNQRQDPRIRLV
jgi:hypothetical protein